ncbi:MAG: hypothetical protein V7782_00605 [Psychromonas sp.]
MIFQLTSGPLLEPTEGSPHSERFKTSTLISSRLFSSQFLAFHLFFYFRFPRFYS